MPGMNLEVQTECGSAIFQCPICVSSYDSSVALQAHAVYSHRVGFHVCAWCSTLVESESKIAEHAGSCTEWIKREVEVKISKLSLLIFDLARNYEFYFELILIHRKTILRHFA